MFFDKIVGMLPLFKSHYSIGKSILTLDDPITHKEGGSDSIFSIAVENNLKEVVLVEDSLTGFLQAKKNADKYFRDKKFIMALNTLISKNNKNSEIFGTSYSVFLEKTNKKMK